MQTSSLHLALFGTVATTVLVAVSTYAPMLASVTPFAMPLGVVASTILGMHLFGPSATPATADAVSGPAIPSAPNPPSPPSNVMAPNPPASSEDAITSALLALTSSLKASGHMSAATADIASASLGAASLLAK